MLALRKYNYTIMIIAINAKNRKAHCEHHRETQALCFSQIIDPVLSGQLLF
jgi:hypothetical protein